MKNTLNAAAIISAVLAATPALAQAPMTPSSPAASPVAPRTAAPAADFQSSTTMPGAGAGAAMPAQTPSAMTTQPPSAAPMQPSTVASGAPEAATDAVSPQQPTHRRARHQTAHRAGTSRHGSDPSDSMANELNRQEAQRLQSGVSGSSVPSGTAMPSSAGEMEPASPPPAAPLR